jgi:DNA excision repair protein ERCC-3
MYYSTKRQQFLIDQGYAFKVITKLEGMDTATDLVYRSHNEQMSLLTDVLLANDHDADLDIDIEANADDLPGTVTSRNFTSHQKGYGGGVKRSVGSMKSLSGADDMAYMEFSGGSGSARATLQKKDKKTQAKDHHPLFKKQWLRGKW